MPTDEPTKPVPVSHDRLFKNLITALFVEFLELFAPQIAAAIDPGSPEFIDKEIFSELELGKENEADVLAKVRIAGEGGIVIIHVENQGQPQAEFNERMFDYFKKYDTKFDAPIYPIAVFTFDKPKRAAPNIYSQVTFGMEVVRFQFQAIQLNRMNWRNYLGSNNPVAVALMTKMNVKPEDRITVRKECLRLFVTQKLDPKKIRVIDEFVRTYLKLTAEDAKQLRKEIEATMPQQLEEYEVYMNEFEMLGMEKGISQGIEQGIEQGLHDGMARLALRLIKKKFGTLEELLGQRIVSLSIKQLEALTDALLDFQSVSELQNWLDMNAPTK